MMWSLLFSAVLLTVSMWSLPTVWSLPTDPAMSKLENAIVSIVEVFEEYAGKDAKKKQLCNKELSELIQSQLSSPEFQVTLDKEDIQEAFGNIAQNPAGFVNFGDFSKCVADLTRGYFRKKHCMDKNGKDTAGQ